MPVTPPPTLALRFRQNNSPLRLLGTTSPRVRSPWLAAKASPLSLASADQPNVQIATDFCLAQKNGTGLLCLNAQPEAAGQQLAGTIQ